MPNKFFIKTTLEWASTSMNSYIIPRGDLCIETFDDGNMKLKIGDGLRVFKQLPYICHGHDDKKYDYYTKEEIDKMFDDITIDLNNYYNKIEIDQFMTSLRSDLIQYIDNNTHYHHNKAILDQITAPFTREEKEKLANIIDVSGYAERIEVLESIAHTHDNKNVLDLITLADVNNWHVHSNKEILDNTTASFTVNYKNILDNLVTYNVFEPASAYESGSVGLVPAPNIGDHVKFLRGDGKWVSIEVATIPIATTETLGGVIIGDGINVDENGVISVDSHDVVEYIDGDAIELRDVSVINSPFIKFNGSTSVFDTGVIHQAHDKFEVILREPTVSNKNRTVFGSRIYNIDSNDITLTINSNQKFAFDRSSTARIIVESTDAVSTDIIYKIIIQDKSCDIYNYETNELIEHIGDADEWVLDDGLYTLSIGNLHNRDSMQHSNIFGDMELYEFKWYRNDTLIHDWVPYQNDSLVALYDNVTESVLQAYAGANGLTYGTREIHIRDLGSDKTINVLYADGLAINDNNQLYTTGVLDVSLNPTDNTKLNISFWNETKTIQLTGTAYTPGEAIDISTEGLDSNYIEIEYIETYNPNNTQDFSYFDTGYIPGPTTNIELVIAPSRGSTTYTPVGISRYDNGSYATHVFGIAWDNSTGKGVWFNRADQTSNYGGQYVVLSEDVRNKKTTFKTIGSTLYVYNENGDLLGSVTDSDAFTTNSPYSLPIFVSKIHNDAPYSNDFMYGKFYELYIREGDELVHHFIPCKTADQTAVGIYDTITKSFRQISAYGSGGQINLGPEVSGRTFETKINVLYNDGLDVNDDNELINTGVLDVNVNEQDSSKLDIEFHDHTKTITMPKSGVLDITNAYDVLTITFEDDTKSIKLYNPGDGIEFENASSGSTLAPRIKYFRFDITKIRGNNQWVQMEELEFSHNGTVIRGTGVSIAGYKFDGSTPNYSTTGGTQTAAQLIDNDLNTKLCARFDDDGHSYIKIVLSINGEGISPNEVFQYQYFTGDDEPDRDPVSWTVYVSADGVRWTLIDQRDNATINTARTAPAFDKITLDMTDYIDSYADQTFTNINVKPATTTDIGGIIVGNGLSITSEGVLSADAITIDDYVISVTQDDEFSNILHVEYPDGTVDITLPQSEGQVEVDEPEEELIISGSYGPVGEIYKAGTGISITKASGDDRHLPDAYKQIQYIESNEFDQFLDTEILVIPGIKVECDCEVSDAVKDAYQGIFGTKYANNYNCFIFWTRFGGQNIPCFASPSSGEVTGSGFIYNVRTKIVATQSGASWYVNDSLVGSIRGSGNWSYDKPIILFGAAKEGHVESGCKAKCYEFKAYNGDTLTNDLIPCVEIATGEVGMYDLIANKFCKAVDDGVTREPFVAGPDLIADSYITNTGVLDIAVNEEDETVLDVTFYNQTKHIQMSGGSSYDDTEIRSLITALTTQVQSLQTELNTLKLKAVLSDDIKHIDKVTMDEYMSMVRSNDTMYLINDEAGELEPTSSVVPTDTLATSMDNVDIMIIGDLEEVE